MKPTQTVAGRAALVLVLAALLPSGRASTYGQAAEGAPAEALTAIKKEFLVTPDEAQEWHRYKDQGGPAFSGNASWHRMMSLVEGELRKAGVVDLTRNRWSFDLWSTTEWPDDSGWKLVSGGSPVQVAHYGAWSGATGADGITAQLLLYDPAKPPPVRDLEGKIVVFTTAPHPRAPLDDTYRTWFTLNDYEYRSDSETFGPLFTPLSVGESVSYDVWWQLRQTAKINATLKQARAAGGIIVFDMPYERVAGLYTFPVPTLYQAPTLYLDRVAGRKVIEDARKGAAATLTLLAAVKPAETHQLIGYLPGKHYGTDKDETILLRTHTDGPAISQENGALGVLAIIRYFSHIPQAQRPRTLMVYLDNRHYMPGMEPAFEAQDWFVLHPEGRRRIAGLIAVEHLGQMEFKEVGDAMVATGRVEPSFLWTRNDQGLIDKAIQAVKDHHWPRVQVQSVERPGTHGGKQGVWYGMGRLGMEWNLPTFSTMGAQGAYWATSARLDRFDKQLFVTQVAAMAQLTGVLMTR
jgi:alkylated DNA nucleotide flippase Atl1